MQHALGTRYGGMRCAFLVACLGLLVGLSLACGAFDAADGSPEASDGGPFVNLHGSHHSAVASTRRSFFPAFDFSRASARSSSANTSGFIPR